MSQANDLWRAAINRHREQLFGDSSLKLYETTPDDGDTLISELTCDWKGHRTGATTDGGTESGSWQFQIIANEDWETSQKPTFLKIVALTINSRRWKVTKVEEPIGESLIWRLRAEVQK